MRKVAIIGAFGNGLNLLNGQTIKTLIIADELEKEYGKHNIWRIDTYGILNNISSVFKCILALACCKNLIILPAHNALKVLAPWVAIWNKIFHRNLHYIVIGGWLNIYLDKHSIVKNALYCFNRIYVETQTMKMHLQEKGFINISVLPNCKNLQIIKEDDLVYSYTEPFRLITFSRVMKQKGIEDVARVVSEINTDVGRRLFELDIYGQVDTNEIVWFQEFSEKYRLNEKSSAIKYKGFVPFGKSIEYISQYFSLIFPTRFYTEGIPGTIIDSYAAGVPVISAMWESFADVVDDATGIGFEFENWSELKKTLLYIANDPTVINQKRRNCLKRAEDFLPSKIVSIIQL